jgi:hypothetical protein
VHRIHVIDTWRQVLVFAAGSVPSILRVSWLPLAIIAAADYGIWQWKRAVSPLLGELPGPAEGDGFLPWAQEGRRFLAILMLACMAVALHRLILFQGRRTGPFLRVGRTELLYAGIVFAYDWIVWLFIAIALLPDVLTLLWAGKLAEIFDVGLITLIGGPRADWDFATFVFAYLGFCLLVFVLVRLTTFAPQLVADERPSFAAPWDQSRGNFWRLLVLWAFSLAITAIVFVATIFVRTTISTPTPGTEIWNGGGILLWLSVRWSGLLTSLLTTVMFVGTMSYAFKALRGIPADRSVDAEDLVEAF